MAMPALQGPTRADEARAADARMRAALDKLFAAEGSAVLCFARMMREALLRELGFSSIQHYAREGLGFSEGKTRQFIRLAEAIERLPALQAALTGGRLGWTKARVLLGVATPGTEARWLELAARLGRRELEARAAAARASARARREARRAEAAGQQEMVLGPSVARPAPAGAPALPRPTAPQPAPRPMPEAAEQPAPASLRFSPVQRARYDALIERIRKAARPGSRLAPRQASREVLVLAALDLLAEAVESESRQPGAEQADTRVSGGSNYQIIVYECKRCTAAAVKAGGEPKSIGRTPLEVAKCDAHVLEQGRNRSTIPPAVRREVLSRDRHRCRMPGCGSGLFLEAHHVVPREQGGTNDPENLVTLCSACHRLAHEKPEAVRTLLRHRRE